MNKLLLSYLEDVNTIEPMEERPDRTGFNKKIPDWLVHTMVGCLGIISLWYIAQEIALKLR